MTSYLKTMLSGLRQWITGMQVATETLEAGSEATAEWDGEAGLLTLGIPRGVGSKGDKGDPGPVGPQGVPGADGKDAVVDATLTQSGQSADAKVTGDAIGQLKGDIVKLKYINYSLHADKYANYKSFVLAAFTGLNVIEFDVKNVTKIHYKYKIDTPDSRGLYFTDVNDIGIFGVQTIADLQEIDVPVNAVRCYATVNTADDILCYDVYGAFQKLTDRIEICEAKVTDIETSVVGEQPVEILKKNATYTNKTSGGVTYTWSDDKSTVSISGTRTGTSFDVMAGGASKLPIGMEPGKSYTIKHITQNSNIVFTALIYVDGQNTKSIYMSKSQELTVPVNATGLVLRLEVVNAGSVVDDVVDCPEVYTIPEYKGLENRVSSLENAIFPNDDNPLAVINRYPGLLSCFRTVGCIGDSLSSGECAYKKEDGSTGYKDLYEHSWGQCLARMTGNTYYNFSNGGLTTKSWLSSQHAVNCFDGNHDCTAYFVGLGQNDKNVSMPVGTTADIDMSDYNNNADTYYGNYGKIIQKLQAHQPKAPIFCFVDPCPPSDVQSYNEAVKSIADLFENVYLIDLDKYGEKIYRNGFIAGQLRGGHYSAIAYQEMAYIIATYVDWIIRRHPDKFSQIEFIGTDYAW